MQYRDHTPTAFDHHCPLEDRENWLLAPVSQTRDSDPLNRSNFEVVLAALGGESETLEVHRFGHWGPGWYELILVHPSRESEVLAWEEKLSDYPVADEEHFGTLEAEEAQEVWRDCYDNLDRVDYIRRNPNQFDFDGLTDMIGCINGETFCGYPSDLLC